MRTVVAVFVALLAWPSAATPARAQAEVDLPGFSPPSAERQRAAETLLLGTPSAERMEHYHEAMTAVPHHAGTPANAALARWYADRLRDFGFDDVHLVEYEALLPRPVELRVTVLEPERYEARLEEPPFYEDPDSWQPGLLPPYNAYSADGDVTAEAVYVNYGLPSDYAVLDSLGVSVEGRIVIARYGRSWRGIKPRLAAEHGAVGCILYSDPEDDGFVRGDTLPVGKWRPAFGAQRGSVMDMPTYPGDPQTPGRASKPGSERIPLAEVRTIQRIPVLPMGYGDALPLLRQLGGAEAPEAWQGGLDLTYRVGPGPAVARLVARSDWSVRPFYDVIGVLRGREEPEKVVMVGAHRDAWGLGGRDPISGAVSNLEAARILGRLAREGHRPRRSVAVASWGAEEYGLIGSTEYGEDHAERLPGSVVAYLNRESYTAGDFDAGGVHSLQPFVNRLAADVAMPGDGEAGGGSVRDAWRAEADSGEVVVRDGSEEVRLGALGSGSDYTVFLDHLGIPAVDAGFGSGNGVYHSRYDSHWWFTTYGDPGFRYGRALSEFVGLFLLRLANADVLPFDYAVTAETVDRYLDELEAEAAARGLAGRVGLDDVRAASGRMAEAARAVNGEVIRILALEPAVLDGHREGLRRLNDLLLEVEQRFLHDGGLPGRPWFRHQLYAPGFYTGYGVKTLPGVREALEKGDAAEARRMARVLADRLDAARQTLAGAAEVAREIGS